MLQHQNQQNNRALEIAQLPSDPNPQGKKIELYSNLYPIQIKNLSTVYLYTVKFSIANEGKEVENEELDQSSRKLKQDIIKKAQRQIMEELGSFIYRGSNIVCFQDFDGNLDLSVEFNKIQYGLLIQKSKSFDLQQLAQTETQSGNILTQAVNFITKNSLKSMKFTEKGKLGRYFQNNSFEDISNCPLKISQGFITSTLIYGKTPYLMLNLCSRIARKESALHVIKYSTKKDAESLIEKTSVLADYGNERNYIINSIEWNKKITDEFDFRGQMTSYLDYYKKQYNIVLKDKNQPLLKSVKKDKENKEQSIYLVPELCKLTGLSEKMRGDYKLMQEVAQYTKKSPYQKQKQTHEMVEKIAVGVKNDSGLQIDSQNFPQIQGKILNAPNLFIKNNVKLDTSRDVFQINKPILNPVHLKNWVLIYPQNLNHDSINFVQNLRKAAKQLGVQVEDPFFMKMQTNDNPQQWVKTLENDIQQNGIPMLVVSLAKNKNSTLYQQLKQLLVDKQGIISQHVVAKSLTKNSLSVCENIIRQINTKLGKPLYFCEKVKTLNPKSIFVGIDISTQGGNTFVGFTSSLDPYQTQYNSQIQVQKSNEKDFVRNIDKLMMNALINFQQNLQKAKFLPECIVVFRGGVGDSQRIFIQDQEVKVLKNLFEQSEEIKKMNGGRPYNPEFIFTFLLQNSRQIRKSSLQPPTWNFN
ncbi:Ribonuclease H-like domain [Pseudocohnilembus persalinus]|uniref:Ribonuclease H-like domain n=1 Tax=Pseudocohnilembus persalinus TaxID=266149 RepID=A0A0V0R8E8_PSEPJ|nr:Ribonuclease H-like domain [Pseudocohnilembus persalinus]|eukprot:KRX10750.1 Ribonuclease H-like domain [Pseudocohnilembus persalinus]